MMPDPAVREPFDPPADKRPILETTPHDYIESEFPEGRGRCDVCGGGPEAKIHNHVDPLERIAIALESNLAFLENVAERVAVVEHLADISHRVVQSLEELSAIGSAMLGMMQERPHGGLLDTALAPKVFQEGYESTKPETIQEQLEERG
jgi:hypothetical protein